MVDINYNGWMDARGKLKHILMFEAEKELLKRKDSENIDFLYVGEECVAGINKTYSASLRLGEHTPFISVNDKNGDYVGVFFLKDIRLSASTLNSEEEV